MYGLSQRYIKELNIAKECVKNDNRLTSLQKEILKLSIKGEEMNGYAPGEFGKTIEIFDNLSLSLLNEFYEIGRKNYSWISFWFYKKIFLQEMGATSNLILANWLQQIRDQQFLIKKNEDDNQIEKNYVINLTTSNESIFSLLNRQELDNLNPVYTIWLDDEQIVEGISKFLNKIVEIKYLKISSTSEIYFQNNMWFEKTLLKKHGWKTRYQEFLTKTCGE